MVILENKVVTDQTRTSNATPFSKELLLLIPDRYYGPNHISRLGKYDFERRGCVLRSAMTDFSKLAFLDQNGNPTRHKFVTPCIFMA